MGALLYKPWGHGLTVGECWFKQNITPVKVFGSMLGQVAFL